MKISETLQKSSPLIPKREMSKTKYMKLVDTNTELVDKMKYQEEEIEELKIKYNIMKENAETLAKRIDKAIEYKNQLLFDLNRQYITFEKWEEILEPFENILKGSDKE